MDERKKFGIGDIKEEYLMTVGSEAELSIIEGILRAENIVYIVRQREAGGIAAVYTGFSMFGADIYVSNENIERAKTAVFDNTGLEEWNKIYKQLKDEGIAKTISEKWFGSDVLL